MIRGSLRDDYAKLWPEIAGTARIFPFPPSRDGAPSFLAMRSATAALAMSYAPVYLGPLKSTDDTLQGGALARAPAVVPIKPYSPAYLVPTDSAPQESALNALKRTLETKLSADPEGTDQSTRAVVDRWLPKLILAHVWCPADALGRRVDVGMELAWGLMKCLPTTYWDDGMLAAGIEVGTELLATLLAGHPREGELSGIVANMTIARCSLIGEIGTGEYVVELICKSRGIAASDRSKRTVSPLIHQYLLLSGLFQGPDGKPPLEEVISLKRASLHRSPPGDASRAAVCSSLANTLHERFRETRDVKLLREAIELRPEVLQLYSPHAHSRPTDLAFLA
jgi:hypothetical protein